MSALASPQPHLSPLSSSLVTVIPAAMQRQQHQIQQYDERPDSTSSAFIVERLRVEQQEQRVAALNHTRYALQLKNKKPVHVEISQQTVNGLLTLVLLLGVSVLGSVGSIFLMSALTVVETLQTRGNAFLVSLSMSHLLITVFVLPTSALQIMAGESINATRVCHYQWLLLEYCFVVSQLSFLLIAIDCYLGYMCTERLVWHSSAPLHSLLANYELKAVLARHRNLSTTGSSQSQESDVLLSSTANSGGNKLPYDQSCAPSTPLVKQQQQQQQQAKLEKRPVWLRHELCCGKLEVFVWCACVWALAAGYMWHNQLYTSHYADILCEGAHQAFLVRHRAPATTPQPSAPASWPAYKDERLSRQHRRSASGDKRAGHPHLAAESKLVTLERATTMGARATRSSGNNAATARRPINMRRARASADWSSNWYYNSNTSDLVERANLESRVIVVNTTEQQRQQQQLTNTFLCGVSCHRNSHRGASVFQQTSSSPNAGASSRSYVRSADHSGAKRNARVHRRRKCNERATFAFSPPSNSLDRRQKGKRCESALASLLMNNNYAHRRGRQHVQQQQQQQPKQRSTMRRARGLPAATSAAKVMRMQIVNNATDDEGTRSGTRTFAHAIGNEAYNALIDAQATRAAPVVSLLRTSVAIPMHNANQLLINGDAIVANNSNNSDNNAASDKSDGDNSVRRRQLRQQQQQQQQQQRRHLQRFWLLLSGVVLLPTMLSSLLFARAYFTMKEFKLRPYKPIDPPLVCADGSLGTDSEAALHRLLAPASPLPQPAAFAATATTTTVYSFERDDSNNNNNNNFRAYEHTTREDDVCSADEFASRQQNASTPACVSPWPQCDRPHVGVALSAPIVTAGWLPGAPAAAAAAAATSSAATQQHHGQARCMQRDASFSAPATASYEQREFEPLVLNNALAPVATLRCASAIDSTVASKHGAEFEFEINSALQRTVEAAAPDVFEGVSEEQYTTQHGETASRSSRAAAFEFRRRDLHAQSFHAQQPQANLLARSNSHRQRGNCTSPEPQQHSGYYGQSQGNVNARDFVAANGEQQARALAKVIEPIGHLGAGTPSAPARRATAHLTVQTDHSQQQQQQHNTHKFVGPQKDQVVASGEPNKAVSNTTTKESHGNKVILCSYANITDDQLLKSNIIVFVINLALWLPYVLLSIVGQYREHVTQEFKNAAWWFATLNCCSCSYVYAISNKDFRDAFNKLFYYCCCKSHVTFAKKTPIYRRQLDMDSRGNLRVHIVPGLNLCANKPPASQQPQQQQQLTFAQPHFVVDSSAITTQNHGTMTRLSPDDSAPQATSSVPSNTSKHRRVSLVQWAEQEQQQQEPPILSPTATQRARKRPASVGAGSGLCAATTPAGLSRDAGTSRRAGSGDAGRARSFVYQQQQQQQQQRQSMASPQHRHSVHGRIMAMRASAHQQPPDHLIVREPALDAARAAML